jgi:hypothetical protein
VSLRTARRQPLRSLKPLRPSRRWSSPRPRWSRTGPRRSRSSARVSIAFLALRLLLLSPPVQTARLFSVCRLRPSSPGVRWQRGPTVPRFSRGSAFVCCRALCRGSRRANRVCLSVCRAKIRKQLKGSDALVVLSYQVRLMCHAGLHLCIQAVCRYF